MKNFIFSLSILILALTALTFAVSAQDYILLEDFESESTNLTWVMLGAADKINTVDMAPADADPDFALRVDGDATPLSEPRRLLADFTSPRDFSKFKAISMTMCADAPYDFEHTDMLAKITVYDSLGAKLEDIASFEAGQEHQILLDISAWEHSSDISALEIAVIPMSAPSGVWDGGFYIDNLTAVGYPSNSKIDRFLFEEFEVTGGEIVFSEDNTYFDLILDENSTECVLKFGINAYIPAFADTLKLNITNLSSCEEVSVMFSGSQDYSEPVHQYIAASGNAQDYFIASPNDNQSTGITLSFNNGSGNIRFNSIAMVSTYKEKEYITYGDITSCTLSSDRKSLNITGELDREAAVSYFDSKLYLYALDLNENASNYDYSTAIPIAEHAMSTKFKFTIDTNSQDGNTLFKKYVVLVSGPMLFVDTPTYLKSDFSAVKAPKTRTGLIADDISKIADTCAGSTVIDVRLDKLISKNSSGHMLLSSGEYFYFDKNYCNKLDMQIQALTDSNVDISLRLVCNDPDFKANYLGLDKNSENYLVNIQSGQGYNTLRACVEFLASRYNGEKYGKISSFILGNAVNTGRKLNGAPVMSITDFVNNYADAMRLVSLAATNSSSNILVYASVGNIFNYEYQAPDDNRFDSAVFLEALSSYINDEGYFPWGICVEDNFDTYEDKDTKHEDMGSLISVKYPQSLKSFVSSKHIKASGKTPPVMIVSTVDEAPADIISSYMESIKSGFDGSFVFNSADNSEFFDLLEAFNTGNMNILSSAKIDTMLYSQLAGQSVLTTKKQEQPLLSAKPQSIRGEYIYFDFETYTGIGSWRPSFYASKVRVLHTEDGSQLLDAQISKSMFSEGEKQSFGAGIPLGSEISFKLTPVLSFDILAKSPEKEAHNRAKVLVRLISDSLVYEASAYIPYDTTKTLYLDLKNSLADFTSMQILVQEPEIDTANIYIDNIKGYSNEYNHASLERVIKDTVEQAEKESEKSLDMTIIALFVIILSMLLTLTILLTLIFKRSPKQ